MAVTQTTILAAGRTAAESTLVTVDANVEVTVGVFTSGADAGVENLPLRMKFPVVIDTPGDDMTIFVLDKLNTAYRLRGPIAVKLKRPLVEASDPEIGFYKNV